MTVTVRVFRGLPFHSDSRVSRYGKYLNSRSRVLFHTWESGSDSPLPPNVIRFFINKSGRFYYLRYLVYLLSLFFYSAFKIKASDICICMDLDTYLPVKMGSYFRSTKIVFDVVDPAAYSRFKKLPFKKLINSVELKAINSASHVIFPSESRIFYYHDQIQRKVEAENKIILENVPVYYSADDNNTAITSHKLKKNKHFHGVKIGYFGTLDESRKLHLLLDLADQFPEDIFVLIAGSGPLTSKIKAHTERSVNIEFVGKYTPSELRLLYEMIDFTWMCYDEKNLLHKYAAPNKFYEHLRYQKPAIVNSVIPQSKFIKDNNTGLIFDEVSINMGHDIFVNKLKKFATNFDFDYYWKSSYSNYDLVSSNILTHFLDIRR